MNETTIKRLKMELFFMGPWIFAGVMSFLLVLLIVYGKTGKLW